MKKANLKTKITALVLTIAMVVGLIPMMAVSVSAADKYFSIEITRLKDKFPDGKYWNGGNSDKYTDKPCSGHANDNYYSGGRQCNGFAQKLSAEVFGSASNEDKYWTKTFTSDYSSAAAHIATAKPGDVLIFKYPHLVFVTAVTDTTITYADCNKGGICNIRWDVKEEKSTLVTQFKGLEAIRHYTNYPGNIIFDNTTQSTTQVTATLSTDWSNWNMASPNYNSSSLNITTNTSWSASSNVSWITLNSYSGSGTTSIMMYIAANTGAARTGYITIYAGNLAKTITINQPTGAVADTISTDWSNWNMASPNYNSSSLKITTNTSWYAVSSVSWITLSTYSGSGSTTIMMYIAANTGLARTGYITIYAGNATKTITINQPKK